ncbi:hypothetical protein [Caldivirga sp.]|uniref:hypothetical protein n=1 Tax=Caldivirga sp. TaxID=2080243 RepID=UPI003D0CDC05
MSIPRRDDKLANVLKHMGCTEEAALILYLYDMRKKVNYTDYEIAIEEVRRALGIAKRVRNLVI